MLDNYVIFSNVLRDISTSVRHGLAQMSTLATAKQDPPPRAPTATDAFRDDWKKIGRDLHQAEKRVSKR